MGAAFDAALAAGLRELGLAHSLAASDPARRSYEAHARLLREWNAAINLTAIRDPAEVARRHVCDSLSAVPRLLPLVRPGTSLLDLGSGAGYPGLPLAAALPLARVGLLESVRKKARFLRVAAEAVETILAERRDGADEPVRPAGIEVLAERAEDIAEEADHRGAWHLVTARAIGSLAETVELALPLLREGGLLVAWKREGGPQGLSAELRAAGPITRAAGGGRPEVVAIAADSLPGHRLVCVPKERPTPAAYPRSPGVRRCRKH